MEALVITDFLNSPPWDVLESVLAKIDAHGRKLAGSTIALLRQLSSLVPDSEYPNRATMYDPVREVIKQEGNLPKSRSTAIWQGLLGHLEEPTDEGAKADSSLAGFWGELRARARDSDQSEVRLACAQRAVEYAEGDQRIEASFELGLAKLGQEVPVLAEADRHMTP